MDAFAVLGLSPALELDAQLLERRYRDLQRQLHPDKFVDAAPSVRRESLARAVSVNEAYRALRDEITRAALLVARHRGADGGGDPGPADPALLMEVMELREELAQAKTRADLSQVDLLAQRVAAQKNKAREQLAQGLAQLDAGPSESALSLAQSALTRLRYYRRFEEEVAAIEEAALG